MTFISARIPLLSLFTVFAALLLGGCGEDGREGTATSTSQRATATRDSETSPESRRSEQGPDSAGKQTEPARGGEASIEGFGTEASGSQRAAILASFKRYLGALAERDYGTACSHLSATLQGSLKQFAPSNLRSRGCPAILPKLLAPTAAPIARQHANGEVTKVRVEGDQAFVVFRAPGAELYQLTMVRQGGRWKASTVAASVLVPDL